jgi:hypothetical protein
VATINATPLVRVFRLEAMYNRLEMAPRVDLIAYQPCFLDLFIEWRIQTFNDEEQVRNDLCWRHTAADNQIAD